MSISDVLIFAAIAAVASLTGVVANWIDRPKWLSSVGAVVAMVILVVSGMALAYIGGQARPTDQPMITIPTSNDQVGDRTPLEGSIGDGLRTGYHLWAEIHASDDPRFHPAEQPCPVIDKMWRCPAMFVGEKEERTGKRFVITLYEADTAADTALKHYATRDKLSSNAYSGLTNMPLGARPLVSVEVTRE